MTGVHTRLASPLGDLLLTAEDGRLTGLFMPGEGVAPPAGAVRDDAAFAAVRRQLEEYFAGERRAFELPGRAARHAVSAARLG